MLRCLKEKLFKFFTLVYFFCLVILSFKLLTVLACVHFFESIRSQTKNYYNLF